MGLKYNNSQAGQIVESEGLDYAVQHYTSPDSFQDPTTSRLWLEARDACNALERHLRELGVLED